MDLETRVRPDAAAYVLDVDETFHPELAERRLAGRGRRIDNLDRGTT